MVRGLMRVLAVDTSGDHCTIGLWQDGVVVQAESRTMRHGHAEALVPMILAGLDRAELGPADLDLLAVISGPGAFTGLRIGLATIGGLALAIARPIVGVSAFEALARAVPADRRAGRPLLVAVDSRRADPYVQAFDDDARPIGGGFCATAASLLPLVTGDRWALAGSGARGAAALVPEADIEIVSEAPIDLTVLAGLAAARADQATPDPPIPLYLRPPDAMPAPAGRQGRYPEHGKAT